jgi:hypothetical protein
MHQPSENFGSGITSSRQTGTSTVPMSPNRIERNQQSSSSTSTAATTTNAGSSTGENGNVFTLTNIYTFGDSENTNKNLSSDKYRINSFVEVFDQPPSEQRSEVERSYRETYSSSSSIKRKVHSKSDDIHHHYESTNPSSIKYSTGSFNINMLLHPMPFPT